jgi:hypothetical protein
MMEADQNILDAFAENRAIKGMVNPETISPGECNPTAAELQNKISSLEFRIIQLEETIYERSGK